MLKEASSNAKKCRKLPDDLHREFFIRFVIFIKLTYDFIWWPVPFPKTLLYNSTIRAEIRDSWSIVWTYLEKDIQFFKIELFLCFTKHNNITKPLEDPHIGLTYICWQTFRIVNKNKTCCRPNLLNNTIGLHWESHSKATPDLDAMAKQGDT